MDRLNEQVTADMNILRPSDDPITTRQLLELQNRVNEGDQYLSNIQKGDTWLKVTDTSLKGMADIVNVIKGVAANVSGGTDNSAEGVSARTNAVSQLKELRRQLIDMGNTQLGDQYLFAGFNNNSKAFDTTPINIPGDPLNGEPAGTFGHATTDKIKIDIGKNSTITMNISGDELLAGSTNNVAGSGPYGGTNIISTLDSLIRNINLNNTTQVQADAAIFDGSSSQIDNARSEVANRLKRMESSQTMITQDQNTAKGIISDRQNVDMVKAATELNQQKTAFEAALSVTAKISQLSLLDYL
jgi:flagellar hook-associated protein 3 FlgL